MISAMLLARGGTLGISGWGCAAGTLEPLTYTRASSAKFSSALVTVKGPCHFFSNLLPGVGNKTKAVTKPATKVSPLQR